MRAFFQWILSTTMQAYHVKGGGNEIPRHLVGKAINYWFYLMAFGLGLSNWEEVKGEMLGRFFGESGEMMVI